MGDLYDIFYAICQLCHELQHKRRHPMHWYHESDWIPLTRITKLAVKYITDASVTLALIHLWFWHWYFCDFDTDTSVTLTLRHLCFCNVLELVVWGAMVKRKSLGDLTQIRTTTVIDICYVYISYTSLAVETSHHIAEHPRALHEVSGITGITGALLQQTFLASMNALCHILLPRKV